jgi:prolyl-tRNA editing enzyme YbaK/EbsC (Cys-tRNA(Pro) deacylase)
MDDAVALTGMEYGGITPIGLPADWPILVDDAVVAAGDVVVGSGLRGSKILLPASELLGLPNARQVRLAG